MAKVKKKYRSAGFIIFSTLIAAVALVIVTLIVIYSLGYRYLKKDFSDGRYIKFVGKVDGNGSPVAGRLYYSDGTQAKFDRENGTINYTGGNVYKGGLRELQCFGQGTMTYANGDKYEGTFADDLPNGTGKYTGAASIRARPTAPSTRASSKTI